MRVWKLFCALSCPINCAFHWAESTRRHFCSESARHVRNRIRVSNTQNIDQKNTQDDSQSLSLSELIGIAFSELFGISRLRRRSLPSRTEAARWRSVLNCAERTSPSWRIGPATGMGQHVFRFSSSAVSLSGASVNIGLFEWLSGRSA
jgi:hypothetical protein